MVLVNPRNPLNIGAAARAMSNFGFLKLRLVEPYDLAFREAKSAVKASEVMESAQVYPTVAEAIADCSLVAGTSGGEHREPDQFLHRLETGAQLIKCDPGPVAILFGSEKFGLSNDDMSHCHWLMRIPSRPEHSSMNLGQSVAVCLYELIRDAEAVAVPLPARKASTTAQTEVIQEQLQHALRLSGYFDNTATAGATRRLRNLIKRLQIGHRDALIILGMLRQIIWRLTH